MLSALLWVYLISILFITLLGGSLPLMRKRGVSGGPAFPLGESFTAGVFLALSLAIMLPAGSHLLQVFVPQINYPLGSLLAIIAFMFLLSLEHLSIHLSEKNKRPESTQTGPAIPIIMTVMIAIPSFFLGTALGISDPADALFIFVAIMAHKGTAGFALALTMTKSTLSRPQIYLLYFCFAAATPLGIFIGADISAFLSGALMKTVKGVILSLAAGTFLYLGSLHGLRYSPLITNCCSRKGFVALLAGLIITLAVRYILGNAHH